MVNKTVVALIGLSMGILANSGDISTKIEKIAPNPSRAKVTDVTKVFGDHAPKATYTTVSLDLFTLDVPLFTYGSLDLYPGEHVRGWANDNGNFLTFGGTYERKEVAGVPYFEQHGFF